MKRIEAITNTLLLLNIPIIQNVVLTILTVLIFSILVYFINKVVNREVQDIGRRYRLRKINYYTNGFIALLFIVIIWIHKISAVTTIIAVTSVGLVVALQDVILSVVGWSYLMIRAPYSTGDRIEINSVKGDVLDISLFQTILMEVGNWVDAEQSTGRIVRFPNSFVFKHRLFNYNIGFPFIWNEIKTLITFESNWNKAEEIVLNTVKDTAEDIERRVRPLIREMAKKYLIQYSKLTPIVYTTIKDSGVEVTLRYLTEVKFRRDSQVTISRRILEAFSSETDIEFAYPTIRYYQK